jgi:hypothetical protein
MRCRLRHAAYWALDDDNLHTCFCVFRIRQESNPTIAIYNASVVKIYNAISSLVCFENKNNFFAVRKNAIANCNENNFFLQKTSFLEVFLFTFGRPVKLPKTFFRIFICQQYVLPYFCQKNYLQNCIYRFFFPRNIPSFM